MADATSFGTPTKSSVRNRFCFIAWRWHFYASLYAFPFLIMLAATGLTMLWIAALSDINGEKTRIVPSGSPMPVSAPQCAAEAAIPGGAATQYIEPLSADAARGATHTGLCPANRTERL